MHRIKYDSKTNPNGNSAVTPAKKAKKRFAENSNFVAQSIIKNRRYRIPGVHKSTICLTDRKENYPCAFLNMIASMDAMHAFLSPSRSSAVTPQIVVPPGEHTSSLS